MRYSNSPGIPGSETWWRVFHYKDESCQGHSVGCVHRREYGAIPSSAEVAVILYRYSAYTDMQEPIKNGNDDHFLTLEDAIKAVEETHRQALAQALAVIAEI